MGRIEARVALSEARAENALVSEAPTQDLALACDCKGFMCLEVPRSDGG